MNFFEQQDRARRNSGRLVILMILAVIGLIALTSIALVLVWQFFGGASTGAAPVNRWELIGMVSVLVVSVVLIGSFYKQVQLSRGGKVVAQRLGGRLINLDPQGLAERRLLNVVEEMADMISASRASQTNVEMMNTAKQMLQRVLTLGQ